MKKRALKTRLSLLLSLFLISEVGASTVITSATIIPSSLSLSCIDYRIVGQCFWLYCNWKGGCRVRTSTKVKHYMPDVVMSSYANTYKNPWLEASLLTSPTAIIAGAFAQSGYDTNVRHPNNHTKVRFKDVDAYGHPGGAVFSEFLGNLGYSCKNGITPLYPYFVSTLDFLSWRQAPIEAFYPEALIPGMREIGSQLSFNMWGNIYPRAGAVTQADDYKAAAVTVQRAADVLTRPGQLHIYEYYTKLPNVGYWPPMPVYEGWYDNHKWQKLAPVMSLSCGTFPDIGMNSEDGAYAWTLWRPYKCCKKRGQTFLYSIDWDY